MGVANVCGCAHGRSGGGSTGHPPAAPHRCAPVVAGERFGAPVVSDGHRGGVRRGPSAAWVGPLWTPRGCADGRPPAPQRPTASAPCRNAPARATPWPRRGRPRRPPKGTAATRSRQAPWQRLPPKQPGRGEPQPPTPGRRRQRPSAPSSRPTVVLLLSSRQKVGVQACQRGAFVRLIGPNVDPPVWDCPAKFSGATTIDTWHGSSLDLQGQSFSAMIYCLDAQTQFRDPN